MGEDNAGEVFWYHKDLNGLPERMTDEYAEQVWQGRFPAWSETEHESSTRGLRRNLRFQILFDPYEMTTWRDEG